MGGMGSGRERRMPVILIAMKMNRAKATAVMGAVAGKMYTKIGSIVVLFKSESCGEGTAVTWTPG
jgi:hypothetical protein